MNHLKNGTFDVRQTSNFRGVKLYAVIKWIEYPNRKAIIKNGLTYSEAHYMKRNLSAKQHPENNSGNQLDLF